jgi:hypothetical protein
MILGLVRNERTGSWFKGCWVAPFWSWGVWNVLVMRLLILRLLYTPFCGDAILHDYTSLILFLCVTVEPTRDLKGTPMLADCLYNMMVHNLVVALGHRARRLMG